MSVSKLPNPAVQTSRSDVVNIQGWSEKNQTELMNSYMSLYKYGNVVLAYIVVKPEEEMGDISTPTIYTMRKLFTVPEGFRPWGRHAYPLVLGQQSLNTPNQSVYIETNVQPPLGTFNLYIITDGTMTSLSAKGSFMYFTFD